MKTTMFDRSFEKYGIEYAPVLNAFTHDKQLSRAGGGKHDYLIANGVRKVSPLRLAEMLRLLER